MSEITVRTVAAEPDMVGEAVVRAERSPEHEVYNVQPCRSDPLFGALKDRWGLSPLAAAGLFLFFYLVLGFFFSWLSGTALPRPGLAHAFVRDYSRLVFSGILIPVGAYLAMRFYQQTEAVFERLH